MTKDHFVYIIAICGPDNRYLDRVKVGISADPHARRDTLQTGCPDELQVATLFPVPNRDIARALERAFHEAQSHCALHGEWFAMPVATAITLMCANIRACLEVTYATASPAERQAALEAASVLHHEQWMLRHSSGSVTTH